jgi:hypothetical protein
MAHFPNDDKWIRSESWIACFDILGFRKLISSEDDDFNALSIRLDYEDTILYLEKSCKGYEPEGINYCWFSDTFLMFTPDDSALLYTVITDAAKYFLTKCLNSRIPICGAISVGHFVRSKDNRAFMGRAFLDAFEYGDEQDWLGLVLTPAAIRKARSFDLEPMHHDFIPSDKIPMKESSNKSNKDVMAYRFQNGATDLPSYLLPRLHDMKMHSEEKYRCKYERTEKFIEEHYSWL